MAISDIEDPSVFYSTLEHGQAVTFTPDPAAPVPRSLDGILDAEYKDTLGVSTNPPMFHCVKSDVSDVVREQSTITDGATVYTVVEIIPDGTGHVTLLLQEP